MGEQNDEYDVFLCYAWENTTKAASLHAAMAEMGLAVFRDTTMRTFDHIDTRIDGALRGTRMLPEPIAAAITTAAAVYRAAAVLLPAVSLAAPGQARRLTLAHGLRRAGIDVVVYERNGPRGRPQGISLHFDVRGAEIRLSDDDLAELDGIGVRHGVAG